MALCTIPSAFDLFLYLWEQKKSEMHTITINTLNDLPAAASQFVDLMAQQKVFAFYGEMGAGKTTFIKAICDELGVADNVSSPTFALINEYRSGKGEPIYHFDCYRLKSIDEAYGIGTEDYLYSGCLCFIEWPEKIEPLLPENIVNVNIRNTGDQGRTISVNLK